MNSHLPVTRDDYETEVDLTLAESFPASDPPSWTLGASPWMQAAAPTRRTSEPAAVDVVLGERWRIANVAEALLLIVALPFAILSGGVPVIMLVLAVIKVAAWLLGTN